MTEDDIGGAEELASTLESVWRKYAIRVFSGLALLAFVVGGLVIGNFYGAKQAIARNAEIMTQLHQHVETNNSLIRVLEDERELSEARYKALLAAFETLRRSVERRH